MFSKYDVYTTVQSMYCYPDTDVLINKLDIRDKAELKQAEEEFTAVKQMALLQEPIKGRFTKTHLFRIHSFLLKMCTPLQDISARNKSARATRCSTRQT